MTKGSADPAHVSEAVIAEFSTRRSEIRELVSERAATGLAAVGAIQRETRERQRRIDRRFDVFAPTSVGQLSLSAASMKPEGRGARVQGTRRIGRITGLVARWPGWARAPSA